MIHIRRWLLVIFIFLLSLPGTRISLWAQAARPAVLNFPAAQLEKYTLPLQDNRALQQEELERRQSGRAPRFAESISVRISPDTDGRWDHTGTLSVWRLRLLSPSAYSLNLGFTRYQMPAGGKLFLYDLSGEKVTGPFTPADNETHNELWTPIFAGDELIVEVQVPTRRRQELQLELTYVNHDFSGFGQSGSGSCNLDIVCGALDGWEEVEPFRDASRSVGVYSLQGSLLCTGFLVNNTQRDCTPYFMTANHCEITSDNAASVVVYWNYANSTCRQPNSNASGQSGDGELNDFNTGSVFRAGWSDSDFCLIELDDPVSETANAFFAGWSARNELPQGTLASVHHPLTDEKRISLSEQVTYFSFWGNNTANAEGNHIIVPSWTTGSTQSGSSGAPLFNSQGQVVGQLHGGDAACGNSSYDSFGRFYNSWEGGGTPDSRLKDWLDPLDLGTISLNGRDQSNCDFWVNTTFVSGTVCAGGTDTLRIRLGPGFSDTDQIEIGAVPESVRVTAISADPEATDLVFAWAVGDDAAAGTYTSYVQTPYDTVYFQFNIIDQVPDSPDFLFPFDQVDNQGLQILLGWASQLQAGFYQVQVATDTAFANLFLKQTTAEDTTFILSDLTPNTAYYWRIKAGNLCGEAGWSATHTFSTGDVQCRMQASSDGPLIIPSVATSTISSSISIDEPGTIASIEILELNIQHRWVGDLQVMLQSPGGKEVALLDRPGFPSNLNGCDGANLLLNFNQDVGANYSVLEQTCGSFAPSIAGTFQPLESLAAFVGEKAEGTWKLIVKDLADEDGGQLISWQMNICTLPEVAPLLSGLEDSYAACIDQPLVLDIAISEAFFGAAVMLMLDETPLGASAVFSKNPATPGDTVRLTLDNLLVAGTQALTISATDGVATTLLSLDIEIEDAPIAVSLIEPEPATMLSGPSITFAWAPTDAGTYRLEIASDPDFSNMVFNAEVTSTAYTLDMPEASGEFYWRVFVNNLCGESISAVSQFTFSTTASSDLEDGQYVQVYPNPFGDQLYLQFTRPLASPIRLRLLDISGRLVSASEAGLGTTHTLLTLDQLAPGVYLLEMQYEGRRYVQRVIRGD